MTKREWKAIYLNAYRIMQTERRRNPVHGLRALEEARRLEMRQLRALVKKRVHRKPTRRNDRDRMDHR